MTWLVRPASLMVLAAALSFGVPASAFPTAGVNLDAARMFAGISDALISLPPAQRHATHFTAALFNVTIADSLALPAPAAQPVPAVAHVNLTLPAQRVAPTGSVTAQAFATAAP